MTRDRDPERNSAWVPVRAAREKVLALLTAEAGTITAIADAAGVDPRVIRQLAEDDNKTVLRRDNERVILRLNDQVVRRAAATVPKRLAVQRLRSLQANGWPMQYLAARLGHSPTVNAPPFIVKHSVLTVTQDTERKVEALYAELGDRPGPSSRARGIATRLGWKPPIHYTDDGYPILSVPGLPGHSDNEEREARRRIEGLFLIMFERLTLTEAQERLALSERTIRRAKKDTGLRTDVRVYGRNLQETVVAEESRHLFPLVAEAKARIEVMEDAIEVWDWLVKASKESRDEQAA